MRPAHWLALPLVVAAALSCAAARAAGGTNAAVGQAVWNAATKGKTTTIAPGGKLTTIAPAGGGGSPIGQVYTGGNSAGGGVAIAGTGNAPVNGKSVPVSVTGSISKDALAQAAAAGVCAVASAGVCIGAAAAVAAMPHVLNWLDASGAKRNAETGAFERAQTDGATQSDGYRYWTSFQIDGANPQYFASASGACQGMAALWTSRNGLALTDVRAGSGTDSGQCLATTPSGSQNYPFTFWNRGVSNCPAGYYVTPFGCYSSSNLPKVAISPTELVDLLKNGGTPDPGVVQELIGQGQALPAGGTTVTGPGSITGPTTVTITNTTNNNNPVTTTTTTTNNYTYNGYTITNTGTTTTRETKDKDGNTLSTEQETTQPGDEEKPEEAPVDTPLGDLPKLYDRKYPDGIVGIWTEKRQQLNQTQLFQLPQQLMPTGVGGGSCPTFTIPLDFVAFGNFGVGDVSPPCWIYDVLKVIVLIGAAILARALIFGG